MCCVALSCVGWNGSHFFSLPTRWLLPAKLFRWRNLCCASIAHPWNGTFRARTDQHKAFRIRNVTLEILRNAIITIFFLRWFVVVAVAFCANVPDRKWHASWCSAWTPFYCMHLDTVVGCVRTWMEGIFDATCNNPHQQFYFCAVAKTSNTIFNIRIILEYLWVYVSVGMGT